jgi:hypothetical protein
MVMRFKRMKIVFGLVLVLALVSLGCGLTERLGSGSVNDAGEADSLPTRTPWPTFTPTPDSVAVVPPGGTGEQSQAAPNDMPTPTPMPLPTDTPTPMPAPDTPTPVPPPPTDTPPPPTNTPAPPPPPTNTPAPPPTPKPQYQFTPAPWYGGDRNDAIVRFYGHLLDTNGNPVNGYSVRVTCGGWSALSFPSGPSPVAPDWAPGWYDIVANPISCNWTLQVVEYQCDTPGFFDAECKQFNPLSEAVSVVTDVAAGETIIVADWVKNW